MSRQLSQYETSLIVLALRTQAVSELEKAINHFENNNLINGTATKNTSHFLTQLADEIQHTTLTIG